MKKNFLNFAINCIKESHPDYDDIKIAEMRYSLEGFYLSFTKLIIIAAFSLILGVFKEMLIMLVIFNVLRSTGFGLHALKVGYVYYHPLLYSCVFHYYQR